jgi:hypothetical protein
MTSRERVLAAFAHVEPDIVPRWCGASPEFLAKARWQLNLPDDESFFVRIGDDFRRVFARYVGPARPLEPAQNHRRPLHLGIPTVRTISHQMTTANKMMQSYFAVSLRHLAAPVNFQRLETVRLQSSNQWN